MKEITTLGSVGASAVSRWLFGVARAQPAAPLSTMATITRTIEVHTVSAARVRTSRATATVRVRAAPSRSVSQPLPKEPTMPPTPQASSAAARPVPWMWAIYPSTVAV
ncbi:hypothetical protein GCM10023100_04970 [Actinocorallia cavernae]|uniref:Secreted protein n=2 Tax=Actinomycetes TaxID=1760 RepID=A0ABP8SA94_9ACTN